MALQRINKDLQEISLNPPALCTAGPAGDDLFEWNATLHGLPGTPYAGGNFKLRITFPKDYPMRAPQMRFITQIFHPNIYSTGSICHDILGSKWAPILSIADVLSMVCVLLNEPNPESPANSEAGNLFKNNRTEFNNKAREWTRRHAV